MRVASRAFFAFERGFGVGKMRKMELLAPAGDMQSAKAAFSAGADACYIGGGFSARAYAANFAREEILELLEYAHLRGKKVHVAINIMLKQSEVPKALEEAAFLYETGVDAIIASDLGFLSQAHRLFPELPLHASTQMGVQDAGGARLAAELGCSRVVAARETTLEGLRQMAQTGIEVESFCHGALCSGVSGACLLSGMAGGRSGNRGKCAQPCRQSYELLGEQAYHLSTKDLCAIGLLGALREAGVCSLKIEGRMKRPEYVAIVTHTYRQALDALENGTDFDLQAALQELRKIYNRGGFCTGYLENSRDVTYLQRPGHLGIALGKIGKVRGNRAVLDTQEQIQKGDGVEFRAGSRSHGGLTLPYADRISGGYRVAVSSEAREGDIAYRTTDAQQMRRAQELMRREITWPAQAQLIAEPGQPARLRLSCQGQECQAVAGEACQEAQKPLDRERIAAQLGKTGGTVFRMEKIEMQITGNPFLPASILNGLRRQAIGEMEQMILRKARPYEARLAERDEKPARARGNAQQAAELYLAAQVQTAAQAQAALEAGAERVYLRCACDEEQFRKAQEMGISVYLALPAYLDEAESAAAEKLLRNYRCFCGVLAGNLAGVALARKLRLPFVADFPLNIASSEAANCLEELGAEASTVSAELNLKEIAQIGNARKEVVAFGRIPVMYLRHCPLKKQGKCGWCGKAQLRDAKGYEFPLVRGGVQSCLLQVLASVPMAAEDLGALRQAGAAGIRLCFWQETPEQVAQVILTYEKAQKTGALVDSSGMIKGKVNKGHLQRGIE